DNVTATNGVFRDIDCGAVLEYCVDCTLEGLTLANNTIGAVLGSSSQCQVTGVTFLDNTEGLILEGCTGCNLTGNEFEDCAVSIRGGPGFVWRHEFTDNTVNGKELGYFLNLNHTTIDGSSYGQVIIAECRNLTIENAELHSAGVLAAYADNITISDCIIVDSIDGVNVHECNNFTLKNSIISNSTGYGVYFNILNGCILVNNIISWSSLFGIHFRNARDCLIINNTVSRNGDYGGICIGTGDYMSFLNNTITDNEGVGISLGVYAYNISVYYNLIGWNGVHNADDYGVDNQWDDNVSCGNWWGDYTGTGTYPIQGTAGSVDKYPQKADILKPTIDHPPDMFIDVRPSGSLLVWKPLDSHPSSFEVSERSLYVVAGGDWNGSAIVITLDDLNLGVGTYVYTLTVIDTCGNSINDTVTVTVLDFIQTTVIGVTIVLVLITVVLFFKRRPKS
ncbi:MAG: NosD domain-containing protein, partial [Candidatus Thorarchaeota archaeon]